MAEDAVTPTSKGLVDVLLVGPVPPGWVDAFELPDSPATAAAGFSVRHLVDDGEISVQLAERLPHVIFTFGEEGDHHRLAEQSIDVRRRWVHLGDGGEPHDAAHTAMRVFVDVSTRDRFPTLPLVSVFTPTYRIGERIHRAYASLTAQTYANWEWVIYDDSPDDATWQVLRDIAASDHRVQVFRSDRNLGVIGEIKRRLCGLARGSILVELDHDDELTPSCLASVVEGFQAFPDAGFVYTDCVEMFEDGQSATYGDSFAFGFGSYRTEVLAGHQYAVTNYPSINSKTVRHIVGMPNHVRAWRADVYHAIGGHGSEIHVADDYELCIRTFLATRMVHVRRFGYKQYLSREGANTQRVRNKEIQRLVHAFAVRYEDEIHARFVELGVDDFIRADDGTLRWDLPNPVPAPIANYELF